MPYGNAVFKQKRRKCFMSKKKEIVQVQEKVSVSKWIPLSLQHTFAMFSASVLVPLLLGINPSIVLLMNGIGTLLFIFITKGKSPAYLGSSFAFIAPAGLVIKDMGYQYALGGFVITGLIFCIVAIIIKFAGTSWINTILPPAAMGPVVALIGLELAKTAALNGGIIIKMDSRVINMEKTNIRHLDVSSIEDDISFISIDVSFISLKLILPVAERLLSDDGKILCLVKPQFEAGRDQVGKKGIVRNPEVHIETLTNVISFAKEYGLYTAGLTFSPIKGAKGNIEYLLYLSREFVNINEVELIEKTAVLSHHNL